MKYGKIKQTVILVLAVLLSTVVVSAARLIAKTGVKGAEIRLDGSRMGFADRFGNLIIKDVKPGKHQLEARANGFKPVYKTVTMFELDQIVSLKPERGLTLQAPNLLIDGNVAGVKVFFNGKLKGITGKDGKLPIRMPGGRYRVEFRLGGYRSPKPITIEAGDITRKVTFRMQKIESAAGGNGWFMGLLITLLVVAIFAAAGFLVYLILKGRKGDIFHGHYRLKGIIGRGGMATIYKARDIKAGKTVVLKIMDPGLLSDPDLLKKFLREGEVLQKLNKQFPTAPIVKVYEYGRENGRTQGRPFIAMEYLKGHDLLVHLKQAGTLTTEDARSVILQVTRALKAAHAIGVYHRDLTPDNIILTHPGQSSEIRLIDFGVARHEYTSAGTLDGSITGKPPYMSPEQCRGMKVDSRSDIYSLGVVFYTLLTGHPPFVSPNPLEVMKKHESEPVPALPESVPTGIAMVIYKMLEKDPGARYRSADQLIQVLGNIREG